MDPRTFNQNRKRAEHSPRWNRTRTAALAAAAILCASTFAGTAMLSTDSVAQTTVPSTALPLPTFRSPVTTQTVSYTPSDENFANPERGYTFQADPPWPAGGVAWDFCGQGNNFTAYNYEAWNDPLTPELIAERRDLGQSVIQVRYHIAAFRTQALTSAYLEFLNRDFATARQGGIKLVVRFAYNYPFGGPDASLARILGHLDQLKPILQQNKDVIAFMEAGFVGCWGEWHNSSNGLNYFDTSEISPSQKTILTKILDVLPQDRMVAIRYPRQMFGYFGSNNYAPIAPLTADTAYSGSAQSRLGVHDDCLVCSDVNGGTYLRDTMATDKAFLNQNNLYTVQGGEVGQPESIDPAVPPITNSPLASCGAVRTQFVNARYSVIGLFDVSNPTSSIRRWERDGCAGEFQRNVGYRFRLIDSTIPTAAEPRTSLNLSLKMANDGYARPFNPRRVELVLRNKSTGAVSRIAVPTGKDARLWLPGPNETKTLSVTVTVPAALSNGTYEALLNLPDPEPTLNTRPEFSMRLANADVWEASTGYNSLQTSVSIGSGSPPPPKVVKIMAMGDSLTEGKGPVPGEFQSYRGHLYNSLIAAGHQIDMVGPGRWFTLASSADGEYAGFSGYSIGPDDSGFCARPLNGPFAGCPAPHMNLYENVDDWLNTYTPEVITLMIGANDQFPESLEPGQTGAYRNIVKGEGAAKFQALVAKIRVAAPNAQLVLGGLSRVNYTSDTPEMAAIRATAKRIAEASPSDNVTYADIWGVDLQPADFADLVHYTDAGAAKVAAGWFPAVQAAVTKARQS
jgi:Domain of unknown function (DUF4832)/Domain of unknown function (DUF4874)/GDSL-like Lipase/Acylhydrolase family